MNPDPSCAASTPRLRIATRLFATIYPAIAGGEQSVVSAHIKAALAHADELIALEAASRPAANGIRQDSSFVSDGNEG